jgi:uncharacterized protein
VVEQLAPYGLNGVKITLDGDRDTHNRMRPLRGRQGHSIASSTTSARSPICVPITIGGNFDESSVDSYPDLLDFLKEQEFADKISKINFKPIIKVAGTARPTGIIPLTVLAGDGKPLNANVHDERRRRQAVERLKRVRLAATSSTRRCSSCATRRAGEASRRPTVCTWARARSIGGTPTRLVPDGSLYSCPGFTGDNAQSTGHIDGRERRGGRRLPNASSGSLHTKRSAGTVRTSLCAAADVRSPRTRK